MTQMLKDLSPDAITPAILRAWVWGALIEHHPEIDIIRAGMIIQTAKPKAAGEALGELISATEWISGGDGQEQDNPQET